MKEFIIKHVEKMETGTDPFSIYDEVAVSGPDSMDASDGYHTFTELYDHRIALFIALCKHLTTLQHMFNIPENIPKRFNIWRSQLHSDGSSFEDWFILGINKAKGEQITYHLPMSRWEETEFAQTLEKAPEWDGHTPADVLERIKIL